MGKNIIYKLEEFEGPIDLLLHLISKHKIDIYDIKISELLDQYLIQIELMEKNSINIASEFLEMAARLVYIKSCSLLPKNEEAEKLKEELTGQLLEYQEYKKVAEEFFKKINLDFISRAPIELPVDLSYKLKHNISELMDAYISATGKNNSKVPVKIESFSKIISKRIVSIFSKVIFILRKLYKKHETDYDSFFKDMNSKSDSVATFLAILELIKVGRISVSDDNKKLKLIGRH